jgi:ubiquinone/menaquinone biosynthesis C-methylase UbiE
VTAKHDYKYSARTEYERNGVASSYERLRFTGLLGRYRFHREQQAFRHIYSMLPNGIGILDCPCGNGRWWPMLREKASSVTAVDVSEEMLQMARQRAPSIGIPISVMRGEAEHLDLETDSVDYVFSFALTKHLPIPLQYAVLREFSRVAKAGVICSFGVFNHFTYEFWRRRNLDESYPVFVEELQWMAKEANLTVKAKVPCTTPVGVEHLVLFEKALR